jgi:hypothetical protein
MGAFLFTDLWTADGGSCNQRASVRGVAIEIPLMRD